MTRLLTLALTALLLPWLSAAPQKRTKAPEPADFPSVLASAKSAWEAQRYGACVARLQEALVLASAKRVSAIRAALPPAPEGWTLEAQEEDSSGQQSPLAAMMAASVGSVVQASYDEQDGGGRIDVSVTADSPLVPMFQMWVTNPALLDENSELIEYDEDMAVLRKDGERLELQVLIGGKHVLEVDTSDLDVDALLAFASQAAVDRLSKALSE